MYLFIFGVDIAGEITVCAVEVVKSQWAAKGIENNAVPPTVAEPTLKVCVTPFIQDVNICVDAVL